MMHPFTEALNEREFALLEATGLGTKARVLLRGPVTVAVAPLGWISGLAAALLAFALGSGHQFGWEVAGSLVAALLMVASLVAHEYGHLVLARHAKGITPRMIVVRASGGVAVVEGRYEDARGAALFAAGGPIATALVSVLLLVAAALVPAPLRDGFLVPAALNALQLVLNLIPIAPTDGYLLFRSGVWAGIGNRAEAERRALDWSRAVVMWAAFVGLSVLARGSRYALVTLFFVGTLALQHHSVARRMGAKKAPAPTR
ncbi:MAG TPA: hypothetical protein VG265_11470 [Gaiellaceae bacterium]|nr:hypothetical protein [Gaiellaceae bacterium]